ncbi:glycoside hydrolase family 3 protein, partial [Xanthomonas oryzae pv. oryzae]
PLFPFGYGLSYTRFAYDAPQLSSTAVQAGSTLQVTTTVRNTGARAGDEVAQVYLQYPDRPQSPLRSLVGFQRVHLAAGEQRTLTFNLDARALSDVDRSGQRAVEAGNYTLFVGGGQPDTGAAGNAASFSIQGRSPLPK